MYIYALTTQLTCKHLTVCKCPVIVTLHAATFQSDPTDKSHTCNEIDTM